MWDFCSRVVFGDTSDAALQRRKLLQSRTRVFFFAHVEEEVEWAQQEVGSAQHTV